MTIIVDLMLATICFTYQGVDQCNPVLLGKKTAAFAGEYTLTRRFTDSPGYGGDVLQFHETQDTIYAIHRVWLLSPKQKRIERLRSGNVKDRYVTAGCINVEPEVYEKLLDCCREEKLIIK
jgi:hypothetical protein